MHFPKGIMIYLLVYHSGITTEASVFRDEIFPNEENIIEQLFAETKIQLEKHNPRQVTIVGASNDQLRQTKSLLEAFPCFVGRGAQEFCTSREFGPQSITIYFLASLDEEYVMKVVESLFNCKKNGIMFIFEGMTVDNDDIDSVLRTTYEKIAKQAFFVHHSGKSLKLYGFSMTAECSVKAELFGDWIPWENIDRLEIWHNGFTRVKCPVTVGTMNHPPWMNLAEDANGDVRIINGFEGEIISTISQKLNFTPVLKMIKTARNLDRLGKTEAIVESCATGQTAIGIGHVRPTEDVVEAVDISRSYAQECIVWCVPKITRRKNNIMISEFSWMTWVLIGLTFLASFVLEKIVRSTPNLNRGNADDSGYCRIILDLIGSTLGNPIVYRPLSIGGKVLLMIYICYSVVITTAYKTSLSSMFTIDNHESSIVDIEGIIKANLTTGGSMFKLAILEDQIGENELIRELIKRFVNEPDTSKALRRISQEKDFACLTSLTDLTYHKNLLMKAGELVSFDVLTGCVLTHSVVMVLPKSSHCAEQMNQVTQRLANGGFLAYWLKNNLGLDRGGSRSTRSSEIINTVEKLHRLTRNKFHEIFYTYCLALIFCILVFLGEFLVHKFKSAGDRVRRFKS